MEKTKFYKKVFMTPGIVSYEDKGEEIILLKKEVIDKALHTFKYKPVIITHDGEKQAGEVVDCYYNTDKGAFVCGFNVWDKKAQDLLDNQNFSVSCTYKILDSVNGGKYHNIDYNEEATDIVFKNLAIVNNPRYEEAKEYINSIDTQENGETWACGKRLIELVETYKANNTEKKFNEKREIIKKSVHKDAAFLKKFKEKFFY